MPCSIRMVMVTMSLENKWTDRKGMVSSAPGRESAASHVGRRRDEGKVRRWSPGTFEGAKYKNVETREQLVPSYVARLELGVSASGGSARHLTAGRETCGGG